MSPPETTIVSGPSGTVRSAIATFELSSSEPGSSFECRLDDGAFKACSARPRFQVANGFHRFEARAVDGAGNADPTPAQRAWWADALLANGTVETPTAGWADQGYTVPGWKPYESVIKAASGGMSGGRALRVSTTSSSPPVAYASPRPINSAVAGTTYTLRGHLRSDSPGKQVCLRIREYADRTTLLGNARACKATTGSWAAVGPVSYTIKQDGSELDVDVHQSSPATSGDNFKVDGLILGDGQPAAVPPPPSNTGPPVLLGAADVASCWSSGDEAVSRLLDGLAGTIVIAGDTEQNHGRPEEFAGCYDPSWGRHRSRTMPAVGDHEYGTADAGGYFGYFGAAAGESGKGWHSFERGDWHIVALNSNCGRVGGCGPGSEQYAWLERDLERHGGDCVGAVFHHPLFSSGGVHGSLPYGRPFWDLLYAHGAEWVLSGNDHNYQRFAPQTPSGALDPEHGIRQFVVGTGGTQHYPLGAALPNAEVQNSGAFGVLELTLREQGYEWRFVAQPGKGFADSGSTACSTAPPGDDQPPDTAIDSGPSGTVAEDSASFTFSATESGASFECSLDGAAFAPCSSPKSYSGLANGAHSFAVRAIGATGNVDPSPATRDWTVDVPPPNLLGNGSFESGLAGWYGHRATLSTLAGGPDGHNHARVALAVSPPATYSLIASPPPVGAHPAGERYEARGWVRSEVPGGTVCLRLREWAETTVVGAAQSCRTATTIWERFNPVAYTTAGGTSIDVYAYASNASAAGDSFDVDGLSFGKRP